MGRTVQARGDGLMRDKALPEIFGTPYQKTAIPEVGEGDRTGFQDGPSLSVSGHTMSSRGGRSIFGRTVRGHELVRDTRKEGDNNTKRSPAGQAYLWGAIDSAQQQKSRSFSGPPPILPREQPRKATYEYIGWKGGTGVRIGG